MKSKLFSRRRAMLAGLALGALLTAGGAGAQAQTTLRVAHASTTDSLIHKAILRFADEVKKETGGALSLRLYPNGQLGDEAAIADGVGNGSIDIGLGGAVDAIDPKLNVLSLPFLFKDAANVHAFLDGAEAKAAILGLGANRGYVLLGALDSGFRQFATSSKPIVVPGDLKGLKIRTPPNPVILATMKQLGALAEAIPYGQVYTALQSKVVDGVEPEIRDFYDVRWYETAKFLSVSNYIWTANWWFINKAKYDALPAKDRTALTKAVADTTAWYRTELDKTCADVLEKLKAKSVKVNTVDVAPFREMVKPVYETFSKEWGADLVAKVQASAAK